MVLCFVFLSCFISDHGETLLKKLLFQVVKDVTDFKHLYDNGACRKTFLPPFAYQVQGETVLQVCFLSLTMLSCLFI